MSERKKGLVPRLRFPEFREAGEWEEITLDDVCERIMDGTHFSPKSKSGPYLYLTSKNVRQGFLVLNDVSHISADEHKSIFTRCPVKKNDLLLTKDGASTGNCALNPLDYEFSLLSSVAVIRGNNENILQEFLAHDFQSRHVQDQIFDAIAGQAITRITLEKIKRFKVWSISLKEQQKIAACLTTLDALIAAQADKLDALKTHKQGLMQRLFPREGETVPRLRFPEFREAGEWEEITLGKIAKFISGGTPSKDVADYWKGSIPWISASSMHDIKIEKSDFSITDAAVKAGTRIAKKGTLLLLVRGTDLYTYLTPSLSQEVSSGGGRKYPGGYSSRQPTRSSGR